MTIKFLLKQAIDVGFDAYYGIDTCKNLMSKNHDNVINFMYEPLNYLFLKKIFIKFPIKKNDNIIDVGCGKGRILSYAALKGCTNLTGVEIDPYLASIADYNLNILNNRGLKNKFNYNIVVEDAQKYVFKDNFNKVFFYNPFHLKIFIKVIKNIYKSYNRKPRRIYIYLLGVPPSINTYINRSYCLKYIYHSKNKKSEYGNYIFMIEEP